MKRTLLGLLLCLTVLSLFTVSALAAGPRPAGAKSARVASHPVNPDADTALKKIFSNLGTDPTDLYDSTNGWLVMGDTNPGFGYYQHIAIPFVPKNDSTITKVKVALQYYNIGAGQSNAATVAIYNTLGGLPNKAIAKKTVTNMEDFGTGCCNLKVATLATPLHVKGGKKYWVVGTTNAQQQDVLNVWDWTFNDAPATFAFEQTGLAWTLIDKSYGYAASATGVFGTIP